MIYVVGVLGFICGFALALQIIARLLKERTREELLEDKGLRMTYGLLTWGIAGFSAYCTVMLYKYYFSVAG